MTKPVWLLDIDGVVNAVGEPVDGDGWGGWEYGKAIAGGQEWPLRWAPELVAHINDIHGSGLAEVRWHTTWQADAANFAAAVGLDDFEIAEAPEFYDRGYAARCIMNNRPQWWKLPAAERVLFDEKRPLLWTDDDIFSEIGDSDELEALGVSPDFYAVVPNQSVGLTSSAVAQIRQWLARRRPHRVAQSEVF